MFKVPPRDPGGALSRALVQASLPLDEEAAAASSAAAAEALAEEGDGRAGTPRVGSEPRPRTFSYLPSTSKGPTLHTGTPRPVRHRSDSFKAWRSWRQNPFDGEDRPEVPEPRGRLAVILTGILSRIVFPELLRNVVHAARLTGFEVDVFLSLVRDGNDAVYNNVGKLTDFIGEPWFAGLDDKGLARKISETVAEAGGRAALVELLPTSEEIRDLPTDGRLRESRASRILQYSPYESEVGRNVLRRYQTLGRLIDRAAGEAAARGQEYKWHLELREDLVWLRPLDLSQFWHRTAATLYSADCLLYGGINDKALLYNTQAASLLSKRYSDFYDDDDPLLDNTHNAESYLGAFAMSKRIQVTLVPVPLLGAVSGMYRVRYWQLEVCMRKVSQQWCDNPPVMPEYCDATLGALSRRQSFCSDVD